MNILAALHTSITVIAAPDSPAIAPPGSAQAITVLGYIKWGTGLACVVGLLIVAVAMALSHRRGSGGDHGSALGFVAGASVLAGVASAFVTALGA